MKASYWIGLGAVVAVGAYLFRAQLFGGVQSVARNFGPNTVAGDNQPGAVAQLLNLAFPGAGNKVSVPTNQQLAQLFGQSSPNGTTQTVGSAIALGSQGLGLFSSLSDVHPELAGDSGQDVDPSSFVGNPTETYDAATGTNTGLDFSSLVGDDVSGV